MLFNSWIFLIFLPVVFGMYFAIPHKWRWLLMLLSSLVFYGWWKWEFTGLLLISTLIDYFSAIQIEKTQIKSIKKRWLLLSICSNLGLLIFFKYTYYFLGGLDIVNDLASKHIEIRKLLEFLAQALPVGISFYTFQTMSYTIDVYNGRNKAEKNLGHFALFVSYFPQLVAGPIERYSHLSAQLKEKKQIVYSNLQSGFRLLLFGFFVKMVIADNLSYTVMSVFDNPQKWHWYWVLIGVISFSFQIYADFFGYSLIAQGSAKLFGVDLMDNFNRPYLASNITDFWKRWHISLTTWFRDYLYIPLGGNKVGKTRWVFNIFLVFLISGLWHGANYTYLIWGGIHGTMYLIERFSPIKLKTSIIKSLLTYALVCFAWIFFRAETTEKAILVIKSIFTESENAKNLDTAPYIFLLLLTFGFIEIWRKNERFDQFCNRFNDLQRWTFYCFLIFTILVLCGTNYQPFIYFRF